ncbi:MAG: hypothetical protein PHE38_08220 [Alishewanella agri]|nr:hypothetical protein [Alishewanella agri]
MHNVTNKKLWLVPVLVLSGLLSGCIVVVDAAEKTNGSYQGTAQQGDVSRVNGSISLNEQSRAGKVSTVNGSIRLAEQVQIDSAETVNGSIKAAQNLTVQRGLSTVNGSIETAAGSTIKADISTVNGSIRLSGSEVGGKLQTVNGNISLLAGTVVKGDLIYAERKRQSGWFGKDDSNQPTLTISADSRVEGKIILRQPVQLKLENASLATRVVREY